MVIQRRVAAAALAIGTVLFGAGCGFQSPDETSVEHATIQGADFNVAQVQVRDVFVAVPDPASTTTTGAAAKPYLFAAVINEQAKSDQLVGAIVGSTGSVTFGGTASGSVALPPRVLVSISSPTLRPDGPTAAVTSTQPLHVGTTVPVRFTFANVGTSNAVQVPVVSAADVSFAPTEFEPIVHATFPAESGERTGD